MKYLALAFMILMLTACHKNEEPCPTFFDTSYIELYKTLVFIDKDSNNLLMNRTIDTADIIIKDENGVEQKSYDNRGWQDSTLTKMRYIFLPLIYKNGKHTLTVDIKGKTNTINYAFHVNKTRCSTNSYFDDFKLNGVTYEFKSKQDYYMYTNNGKSMKHPLYTYPMYIVLD